MQDELIRLKTVMALTGISRNTIDRLEARGAFPFRRKIGLRSVAWVKSEIHVWIAELAKRKPSKLKGS